MLPHALSRPLRRLLLGTAWTLATLILIVVLGFLYVTFVGISVDASFLRGTIAQTFSDNIGRPVRFEGPMEMEISAKPKLRIGGLHIANAPGFGEGDFASLGEAHYGVESLLDHINDPNAEIEIQYYLGIGPHEGDESGHHQRADQRQADT